MSTILAESLGGAPRWAPPGLETGLSELDGLLAGGLPVGHLTVWAGSPSCGKTGVLARVVARARDAGLPVAWVDAARALVAADWCQPGGAPLWVVRPPSPEEGPWCVELALQSRAFGLVVLDGGPPLPTRTAVRLQRAARQGEAALVWVCGPGDSTALATAGVSFHGGRPQSEAPPGVAPGRLPPRWPVEVVRRRGGGPDRCAVTLQALAPAHVYVHPLVPDRPATRTRAQTRYGR
jgi:hypothetical protein